MTGIRGLYPPVEPRRVLRVDVGDGHVLHVEDCGPVDGLPVLFLHGGPGSGCNPAQRQLFDPTRYRAILVDQRGTSRSTPLGELRANNTRHLVHDCERIRQALGISRWLVFGGSWGSLLGLAYAQQFPASIMGLVLRGIFLGSPAEIAAYLEVGLQRHPTLWQALFPAVETGEALLATCAQTFFADDAGRSEQVVRNWLNLERALMGEPPLSESPTPAQRAKVAIQMHYLPAACFLPENALLQGVDRVRSIPAVIVQGEDDCICPPHTARALAATWPEAETCFLSSAGHSGMAPAMVAACMMALDRVAELALRT